MMQLASAVRRHDDAFMSVIADYIVCDKRLRVMVDKESGECNFLLMRL